MDVACEHDKDPIQMLVTEKMWELFLKNNSKFKNVIVAIHYRWKPSENYQFYLMKTYYYICMTHKCRYPSKHPFSAVCIGAIVRRPHQSGLTNCKLNYSCKANQRRIQEVPHPGPRAQWIINFGALEQTWRMLPSPHVSRQFGAPEVFFPGALPALELCPSRHFTSLSIYISSLLSFLPFFLLFSFLILFFLLPLFWRSFSDPRGWGPKSPHDTSLPIYPNI